MAHPQLNYSNTHLSQKNKKVKAGGEEREGLIRLINSISGKGYLAMTVTFIFWKEKWLPLTSKGTHRVAYPKDTLSLTVSRANVVVVTQKPYKFLHPLSIHQLFLPQPGNLFGPKVEIPYHYSNRYFANSKDEWKIGKLGFTDEL